MDSFSVLSDSPERTGQIAALLARELRPGDVVLLTGDLAAGKTVFVKAVAAALGSTDLVTSPTFTLAQFYSTHDGKILHVDTYRLADLAEYRDLALEDYSDDLITLIEWGELVASEFPDHLMVSLGRHGEPGDGRTITFRPSGERWHTALPTVHRAVAARESEDVL